MELDPSRLPDAQLRHNLQFDRGAENFKRRKSHTTFHGFRLPPATAAPMVFFDGKNYAPLLSRLTVAAINSRTVYYAESRPPAPGGTVRSFGRPFSN